jgi:hypothetical protein
MLPGVGVQGAEADTITRRIKSGIESDSLIVEVFTGVKLSLRGWRVSHEYQG